MKPNVPAVSPSSNMARAAQLRDTVLFLAISLPLVYMAYRGIPFIEGRMQLLESLAILFLPALNCVFLKRQGQSLDDVGLSRASRPLPKLALGCAAGVVLLVAAALGLRTLLPFHWEANPSRCQEPWASFCYSISLPTPARNWPFAASLFSAC
jgi:hypothetical protein